MSLKKIHLIARAFRPKKDKPAERETLWIVLLVFEEPPKIRLAWYIFDDKNKNPAQALWNQDLNALNPSSAFNNKWPLFSSQWERIDLFGENSIESEGDLLKLKITPRISFDTIGNDDKDSSSTNSELQWTWKEDSNGKIIPRKNPSDNTNLNFSCLFLLVQNEKRYLVANVRLRSFIGQINGDHSSTWQFVIPLGTTEKITSEDIWEGNDLRIRDIFYGVNRTYPTDSDGNVLDENQGFSFSRDLLLVDKYEKPFNIFSLSGIATETWDVPTTENKNALSFRIDILNERLPALSKLVDTRKQKETYFNVGWLAFQVSIAGGRNNAAGIGFVKDKDAVYVRFYAIQNNSAGNVQSFFIKNESFLVQDQYFGSKGIDREYFPRGTDRSKFVEWRVYAVNQDVVVKEFLEKWNKSITCPLITSLRSANDGAPMSWVPSITNTKLQNKEQAAWFAAIQVRDRVSNRAFLDCKEDYKHCIEHTHPVAQPAKLNASFDVKVTLDGVSTFESQDTVMLSAKLCHQSRLSNEPDDKPVGKTKDLWAFGHAFFATTAVAGIDFGLLLSNDSTGEQPKSAGMLRVGAIDFTLLDKGGKNKDWWGWNLFGSIRAEKSAEKSTCQGENAPVVKLEARLPVQVRAGALDRLVQDDMADVDRELTDGEGFAGQKVDEGFDRDTPLVIDLSPDENMGSFQLKVKEAVGDSASHNMHMSLLKVGAGGSGSTGKKRIMVVDRTPFAVYLAETDSLDALASAESVEVAVWTAAGEGGANWRLVEPNGGVEIVLPPQGLGEAMEKGKVSDPNEGEPVDFRFTSHARLFIDPSFEDQRYGETPWNVRRLFGYAGQRMPGVWLKGFDVELLYGLAGKARELKDILLAESESRLGKPAGRQADKLSWKTDKCGSESQEGIWDDYRKDWSARRAQLHSRLAVLETYRLGGGETILEEGLSWYQRKNAHLLFPLENYDDAKNQFPGLNRDFFNSNDGLAGGWTWGFTSLNILEAVLRDPRSTSGFITGLKFSALGGWGFQKASFDEDRSSVYADTSAGRTHFYSVERIGRIGVFWNRAKHVIVFERTVAPSDQFAADQDPHLGRPMLRKVEEYVELLEPERAFPDSDAPKTSRGCVLGLNFKSKRIRVDSTWGEDVRKDGWKVPLWNPFASQEKIEKEKKDVYPRPQIAFVLAADPEADTPTVKALCNTPELLYFYTDTRQGTGAVTDRWGPVLGVDFGVVGTRWVADDKPLPGSAGERLDQQLPPEASVPPGLHDFTFGIDPPERPVNLMVDRSGEAINASLRNITLMRSAEVSAPTENYKDKSTPVGLVNAASRLYQSSRRLEHVLKTLLKPKTNDEFKLIKKDAIELIADSKEDFVNNVVKLNKAYQDIKSGKTCNDISAEVGKAFDRWDTKVSESMKKASEEIIEQVVLAEGAIANILVNNDIDKAKEKVEKASATLGALIFQTVSQLDTNLKVASAAITGANRYALIGIDAFEAEIKATATMTKNLLSGASERIKLLIKELNGLVESLGSIDAWFGRVAEARSSVRTICQQVNEALEKVERIVTSRGDRIGALVGKVIEGIQPIRAEVTRTAQKIDESFVQVLGQQHRAGVMLKELEKELEGAEKQVDNIKSSVEEKIKSVISTIMTDFPKIREKANALLDPLLSSLSEVLEEKVEKPLLRKNDEDKMAFLCFDNLLNELACQLADIAVIAKNIRNGEYGSAPVKKTIDEALESWKNKEKNIKENFQADVLKLCNSMSGPLVDWFDKNEGDAKKAVEELYRELSKKIEDSSTIEQLQKALEELEEAGDRIVGQATAAFEQARQAIESSPVGPVLQEADRVIRLFRAFGDPPKLPKLDFNRAAAAFLFGNPNNTIDMTPMTAWFDQVGSDLKALGIRLPTSSLLDRLLPQALSGFKVGQLLPDFAGLKLEKLLNLNAPAPMGDAVKVTHGLDKQRQRAWAEAAVNLNLPPASKLVDLDPLVLILNNASLNAVSRIETSVDGKVERRSKGEILGDWQLAFSGQTLVTFLRTALHFDEGGRMKFDLSPDRMEMAAALKYLSDMARQLNYDENGFVCRVLERNGLPYGAEAFFDIKLPPLQYGTTGIIGATIGAGMRLEAYPEFAIELFMNVSRKESPFIFSIFILGGAGFVEAKARYLPFKQKNNLAVDVSIGLAASAVLGFAFGPISGSVAVMLGVAVEFHTTSPNRMSVDLMLLVVGRVDVMGIVTVNLSLMLQATYHDTGEITAEGTLSLTIRISCFFKISVSTRVKYKFTSDNQERRSQLNIEAEPAVTNHPVYKGAKKLIDAAE